MNCANLSATNEGITISTTCIKKFFFNLTQLKFVSNNFSSQCNKCLLNDNILFSQTILLHAPCVCKCEILVSVGFFVFLNPISKREMHHIKFYKPFPLKYYAIFVCQKFKKKKNFYFWLTFFSFTTTSKTEKYRQILIY